MLPPESHHALSVLEDHVSIPPRTNTVISVGTETAADVEGIIEGDQRLLLNREINGSDADKLQQTEVMLTNLSQELKYINKGTTLAYIEEIVQTAMRLSSRILPHLPRRP